MWSLPDIKKLNERAAQDALAEQAGRKVAKCDGCGKKRATVAMLIYDIFSDDPKELWRLCKQCDIPGEGYFYCISCDRWMITNYTWECYNHIDESGEDLCLGCYARTELENPENWVDLDPFVPVDWERVKISKHLFAVEQPRPATLKFVGNVELDAMTGGRLISSSEAESSPDGGVEEINELLGSLAEKGHKRALVCVDAAYQFSVSIGIYVDVPPNE